MNKLTMAVRIHKKIGVFLPERFDRGELFDSQLVKMILCRLVQQNFSFILGNMVGAAIGAVIMSSISRLLVFIGLPSTYDNTITGIMLIVIVVVDALTQRRSIEMARRKRLLSRTAETAAEGECHQA